MNNKSIQNRILKGVRIGCGVVGTLGIGTVGLVCNPAILGGIGYLLYKKGYLAKIATNPATKNILQVISKPEVFVPVIVAVLGAIALLCVGLLIYSVVHRKTITLKKGQNPNSNQDLKQPVQNPQNYKNNVKGTQDLNNNQDSEQTKQSMSNDGTKNPDEQNTNNPSPEQIEQKNNQIINNITNFLNNSLNIEEYQEIYNKYEIKRLEKELDSLNTSYEELEEKAKKENLKTLELRASILKKDLTASRQTPISLKNSTYYISKLRASIPDNPQQELEKETSQNTKENIEKIKQQMEKIKQQINLLKKGETNLRESLNNILEKQNVPPMNQSLILRQLGEET